MVLLPTCKFYFMLLANELPTKLKTYQTLVLHTDVLMSRTSSPNVLGTLFIGKMRIKDNTGCYIATLTGGTEHFQPIIQMIVA